MNVTTTPSHITIALTQHLEQFLVGAATYSMANLVHAHLKSLSRLAMISLPTTRYTPKLAPLSIALMVKLAPLQRNGYQTIIVDNATKPHEN